MTTENFDHGRSHLVHLLSRLRVGLTQDKRYTRVARITDDGIQWNSAK